MNHRINQQMLLGNFMSIFRCNREDKLCLHYTEVLNYSRGVMLNTLVHDKTVSMGSQWAVFVPTDAVNMNG